MNFFHIDWCSIRHFLDVFPFHMFSYWKQYKLDHFSIFAIYTDETNSCIRGTNANLLVWFQINWVQFWFLPFEFREFGHINTSTTTKLLEKKIYREKFDYKCWCFVLFAFNVWMRYAHLSDTFEFRYQFCLDFRCWVDKLTISNKTKSNN